MDNIRFKKIWQDENLIELEISANSEFVSAHQSCYIQDKDLVQIAEKLYNYTKNYHQSCYLEFGKKIGNYTPAFSMCILPADKSGHIDIEVDIEIADNNTRSHRCCFYVKSELGLIKTLGVALKNLATNQIESEAFLG